MIELWVGTRTRDETKSGWSVLSLSERERALQIRSATRRGRYVAAHRWLHERVGGMLGVAPDVVPIRIATSGALSLEGIPLHLSLSHDGKWLALAVSDHEAVGVDVLTIPPEVDYLSDTRLVLSPDEIGLVRSSPRDRRGRAFAHCWVRKEAYAKLHGVGLLTTEDLAAFSLVPRGDHRKAAVSSRELNGVVVGIASATPVLPTIALHTPVEPAAVGRTL
jgi:4'-phosphopantetheinyl transferase